jgi:hypothetical protein
METQTKLAETFNFMAGLPLRTLTQRIAFPSKSPTGDTEVGFVAWKFDGINDASIRVFGISREGAVANLESYLANL